MGTHNAVDCHSPVEQPNVEKWFGDGQGVVWIFGCIVPPNLS